MAGTTEDDAFAAALDVCVNVAENSSTTEELSWQQDPGTWMGSQEVAGFSNRLATMDSKLDILIAEREHSNGPVPKRVSCYPPLCSFFVIIAHDVVLFVTRESITKKRGVMYPLRIKLSASWLC